MMPYLERLLGITMNNKTVSDDWKKDIVAPFTKEEIDR